MKKMFLIIIVCLCSFSLFENTGYCQFGLYEESFMNDMLTEVDPWNIQNNLNSMQKWENNHVNSLSEEDKQKYYKLKNDVQRKYNLDNYHLLAIMMQNVQQEKMLKKQMSEMRARMAQQELLNNMMMVQQKQMQQQGFNTPNGFSYQNNQGYYQNNQSYYPQNNQGFYQNNQGYYQQNNVPVREKTKVTCSGCGGTGKQKFNKIYPPTYDTAPIREYCNFCGSYDAAHTHKLCTLCGGLGYIER